MAWAQAVALPLLVAAQLPTGLQASSYESGWKVVCHAVVFKLVFWLATAAASPRHFPLSHGYRCCQSFC